MSDTPRWDREGRDWPLAEHSRFVEAAGLRWHVQIMGAGPVLLLLHGTGAATHSWRDVMPALAGRFTVVAPDLPGHGFTRGRPVGGLTLPAVAHAVAGLLASLEMAPETVVGHSAGAAIAIRLALDGSISPRAVVGLGPALLPFPGIAKLLFPSLARLLFLNPFAPRIFARMARVPGETGRFLERSTGSRIDRTGIDCYAKLFGTADHCAGAIGMMAAWDLAPIERQLSQLEKPVLFLHGARDAAIPEAAVRRAAGHVPGARVEILPGLGHLAHEEDPATIAARIETFASGAPVAEPAEAG